MKMHVITTEREGDGMKIGDRVRVVGPDDSGFEDLIGTEFEITETWKYHDGVTRISAMGVPWFPESSLGRVVDEVAPTINVTSHDYNRLISRIQALEKWQMEHDLEKSSRFPRTEQVCVEMADLAVLKAGDWVEVKQGGKHEGQCFKLLEVGRSNCFKIMCAEITCDGPMVEEWWYVPSALRKLSDDEIARRLTAGGRAAQPKIDCGDLRSLKAIRGMVQALVGPETTSDELALLDRLIEAARAIEEDA